MTGNSLKEYCQYYPTKSEATALCMGYVWGALDAVRMTDKQLKLHAFCEPAGVTGQQLVALTIKYLDAHTEQLHLGAASLIGHMYESTFPCERQ